MVNKTKAPTIGGVELSVAGAGRRRTAYEYVSDSLRQAILSGKLAAGTHLVQTEIAEQLGVSTTPVREALRDLASEGLVKLDAHRGGLVSQLSYRDLLEIHELCRLVEPVAIGRAVSFCDDEMFEKARGLVEEMTVERDSQRWAMLNREFHGILLDAIPSERFRSLLKGLRESVAPYVAMAVAARGNPYFDEANAEHLQILEAMADRDSERAAELTRNHVDLTLRLLDDAGASFIGYPLEPPQS